MSDDIFYTVKPGDTLSKIAEMHYGRGHGNKYMLIFDANRATVKNPNMIQPGWILRIPPFVEEEVFYEEGDGGDIIYTVRPGDTLWKIAEMHYGKGRGAKYTVIAAANSNLIKNPDLIHPGWVLRIPPLF